jgi:hypothetical protein
VTFDRLNEAALPGRTGPHLAAALRAQERFRQGRSAPVVANVGENQGDVVGRDVRSADGRVEDAPYHMFGAFHVIRGAGQY